MRRALAYAGHRAVATWAYTIGLFLALSVFPAPGTYLLRVEYDCGLPWRSVVDIGPLEIGGAE